MKRIISIILAFVMAISALQLNVIAEDDFDTTTDLILNPESIDDLIIDPDVELFTDPALGEESTEEPVADPVLESDLDLESEPSEEMVIEPEISLDPIIDSELSNDSVSDSASTAEPSLDVADIYTGDLTEEVTPPVLYSSVVASGTCGAQGDNLTWELTDDGTLTISGTGAMKDYDSNSLFVPWYRERTSIKSIIIQNSVTSIGNHAFNGCTGLTSVDISDRITAIGEYSFYGCTGLTDVDIPDSVTTIGNNAFNNCTNLMSVEIGNSVTTIGDYAFSNCTGLMSAEIGNSVTTIGDCAFSNCTGLTDVDIPDSVITIGVYAFKGCSSLTNVVIGDSVTAICWGAFYDCTSITSLDIGDNVTTIDWYAFYNCNSLIRVDIPDKVTTIGNLAFKYCTSLTSLDIGNSVTTIESSAFSDCINLTSVDIPDSVTSIGGHVFYNCSSLTSITFYSLTTEIYGRESIPYHTIIYCYENSMAELYARNYYRNHVILHDIHEYGAWESNNGDEHIRYCIKSGCEEYEKDGHIWDEGEIHYEPSCSYDGERIYSCIICNGIKFESIPATGEHIYGNWQYIDVDNHIRYCSCSESEIEPHKWSNEEVTTLPTCAIDGTKTFICTYCNTAKTEPIPATGEHIYGDWGQFNEDEHIRYCSNMYCVADSTEPHVYDNEFDHICNVCGYYADVEGLIAHGTCGEHLFWELSTDGVLNITGIGDMYDYTYLSSPGTPTWSDYKSSITEIVISNGVTRIGNHAFFGCGNVVCVTIPDTVTHIGEHAFRSCVNLAEITIPSSVVTIGNNAMQSCSSLTSIVLPDSLKELGNEAFYYCESLATVEIYSKDLKIGEYVFRECNNLANVIIQGESVSIGEKTFYNCSNLSNVNLQGVITIGDRAFQSCNILESITLPDGLVSIGNYAFSNCSSLANIVIPDCVESIGDSAFSLCTSLKQIYLPANLKHLGEYAFKISGLTSITIPAGVTSIGSNTFYSSQKLTSVEILGEITSIGDHAFNDCVNLKTVNIPDSVEYIGEYAFRNCNMLESVHIPEGVKSIGAYTFYDCYRLQDVTIPLSVETIGDNAFSFNARKITILNPNVEIFDDLWTISATAIYGYTGSTAQAYAEKYSKRFVALDEVQPIPPSDDHIMSGTCGEDLIWVLYNNGELVISGEGEMTDFAWSPWYDYLELIKVVTISEGITSIGNNAFSGCINLVNVNIPLSITRIGENAFYDCAELTYLDIPVAVTQIGAGAFMNCQGLTNIRIPENVASIGENAFDQCYNLSLVTFYNPNIEIPSSLGIFSYSTTVFGYTGSTAQAYAENNGIEFIALDNSKVIASGTCGDNLTWKLTESGVLTINGTGDMSSSPSWSSYSSRIYSVVISDGVTSVGERAFWYCSKISSVAIPSTVTRISDQAFVGCSSLSSIVIPESVISIGEGAFSEYDNLREIYIPKSVKYIGARAFGFCTNLISFEVADDNEYYCDVEGVLFSIDKTSLVSYPSGRTNADYAIPDGVTTIDKYSFSGCKYLSNVTVPESMSKIDANAFMYCTSLEFIEIPDGITKIDDYAFFDCKNLTDICLPETLISIGNSAFSSCLSLTSITIPESVTSIGRYAFSSCDSLQSITVLPLVIAIYNAESTISDTAVIYAYQESSAHSYAISFNREFVPLNDDPDEIDPELILGSGKCGDNLEWIVTLAGRLIITGEGEMYDYGLINNNGEYSFVFDPWQNYSVNFISLSEGITKIGSSAFLSMGDVTELNIPASVSKIGNQALPRSLNKLTVADESTYFTVEDDVLFTKDLTELVYYLSVKTDKTYSIPDTVETIAVNAFIDARNIVDLYIPASVTNIYSEISGAELKAIHVDDANEYYCDIEGLLYNKELTSLISFPSACGIVDFVLPSTVTTSCTISGSTSLKSITFPSGMTFINSISGCPDLEKITFLSATTNIYDFIYIQENVTICGYEGSTAESYAKSKGIKFEPFICAHEFNSWADDSDNFGVQYRDCLICLVREYKSVVTEDSINNAIEVSKNEENVTVQIENSTKIPVSVEIQVSSLNEVADTAKGLQVESGAVITIIDNYALNSIIDDAGSNSSILLKIETHEEDILNELQKDSVSQMETALVITAEIISGEKNICTKEDGGFDEGKVTLKIPFALEEGTSCEDYSLLYVAGDGMVEEIDFEYKDGYVIAELEHFSTYVIAYTSYSIGDIDENGIVDNNDAIYLLYHTIFGEIDYPLNQDCDFDGNGIVDNNDAIYLLYHTIFGEEEYPLNGEVNMTPDVGGVTENPDWVKDNGWTYMYNALYKDSYRQVLDEIMTGIKNYQVNIDITPLLSADESDDFAKLVLPFVSVEYSYVRSINVIKDTSGKLVGVQIRYYVDSVEAGNKMVSELRSAADSVISCLSSSWSDYEKILYLHDWLVKNCTSEQYSYANNSDEWGKTMWPNTAYGAIVDGQPSDLGYSKAMLYLLSKAGYDATLVQGIGVSELHIWVKVMVDGKWYNIDTAWDDPYGAAQDADPNYVRHDYFMVTDEYISDSRTEVYNNKFFEEPECTDITYDWYLLNDCYAATYDEAVDILNKQAKIVALSGGDIEYVRIKLATDDLYQQVKNVWSSSAFVFNILSDYTNEYNNFARGANTSGRTLTYRLYKTYPLN